MLITRWIQPYLTNTIVVLFLENYVLGKWTTDFKLESNCAIVICFWDGGNPFCIQIRTTVCRPPGRGLFFRNNTSLEFWDGGNPLWTQIRTAVCRLPGRGFFSEITRPWIFGTCFGDFGVPGCRAAGAIVKYLAGLPGRSLRHCAIAENPWNP